MWYNLGANRCLSPHTVAMAFVVFSFQSLGPGTVSAAEDAAGGRMAALGDHDSQHPHAWLVCDRRRVNQAVDAIHGLLHASEMLDITSQKG